MPYARELLADALTKLRDNPVGLLSLPFDRDARHTLGRRINTVYHSRNGRRRENPDGFDLFDAEWDNLIVLGACRYDAFVASKRRHDLPGELEARTSKGSQTPEWLYANFDGRQLHDTVYVTGTAMPYHLSLADPPNQSQRQRRWGFDIDVHDLVNVWADPSDDWFDMYIDRIQEQIVPPSVMCDAARDALEQYPHKRLLVHITPPHDPYLGPTGRELHEEAERPWMALLDGELDADIDRLRRAYRENVDLAVEPVVDLVDDLPGRTIVTADHGELLWNRSSPVPVRDFLHPEQTYVEELVRVPWNVVENGTRETRADPPAAYERRHPERTESTDQLRALGYLE